MATTLIIPGVGGSGPGHWQHWWLRNDPNAVLVEQADWRSPSPETWGERLIEAVEAHPYSLLVAHSLGALLVTRIAAERLDLCIGGALLVAPPDVEDTTWATDGLSGFAPISLAPLPFPTTVVASRNDRCMRFRRAKAFADAWRARLIDYGNAGHINATSGFGPWPDGPRLLAEVQARRPRPAAPVLLPAAGAERAGVFA